MKLHVKQLDTATSNTISVALEMYAASLNGIDNYFANKYLELAVMFRHSIPLLVIGQSRKKGGKHGL